MKSNNKNRGVEGGGWTLWTIPLRAPAITVRRAMVSAVLAGLSVLASGCGSLLPQAQSGSPTFRSFDEARDAVEQLVPMQSTVANLSQMGMDPVRQPNTLILTHSDIARRVINGGVLSKDDMAPGIVSCLIAGDACRGWELNISSISRKRTGSFWADFTNFKRRTETTGWRFNALILIVNDVVVYRSWGGQPVVSDLEVNSNPLGPLQDLGPAVFKR